MSHACPLCDHARVDDAAYARVCAAYAAGPARALRAVAAPRASALLTECTGLRLAADDVWRHFAHHRQRPHEPARRLQRERALAGATQLSPRQQAVLSLVGRLDVISASQITRVVYQPHARSQASARAACHRDLGVLVRAGYLARTPLPGALRHVERGRGPLILLHATRQALPYLEAQGLGAPPPASLDLVQAARQHAAHELVAGYVAPTMDLLPEWWRGGRHARLAVRRAGRVVHLTMDSLLLLPHGTTVCVRRDDGGAHLADVVAECLALPHAYDRLGPQARWLVLCAGPSRLGEMERILHQEQRTLPPDLVPCIWASEPASAAAGAWRRLADGHQGDIRQALGAGEVPTPALSSTYTDKDHGALSRTSSPAAQPAA